MGAAGSGTFAISPETPGEMSGPKPGEKRGVSPDVASAGVSADETDGIEREFGIRLIFDILADDKPLILRPGIVIPNPILCVEVNGCSQPVESTASGSNVGVLSLRPAT